MSRAAKVHLTIDTLALAGFAPHERDVIAASLQAELARRFAAPGALDALAANRALSGVRAQPFALGGSAQRTGAAAAQALVQSVTRAAR